MTDKNIRILKIIPLKGPNIWTYRPAIEAWVDIGALEDWPSNTLPGFVDRLLEFLPSLVEHRCSVGERGGFIQRLREGTWAAHILEHVTLELQNLAGQRTGFGKARETGERGIYKVVIRSRQEEVTRAALEAARDLVMAAIEDKPFDVEATVVRLRAIADTFCIGPSTACIVDAATERGIPSIRLSDGNLVQLGYGARQRRIWTAETDETSAISESISSNKDLTKRLLESCGVPIPAGRIVDNVDEAWDAAEDIGLPVVVKPVDGNHGRGVSLDLSTREEVEAAFHLAEREGSEVIVEQYIPGNEHRLLVVDGELVAAARGETAWVTGDGVSTVVELIDSQLNSDPRRGISEDFPLNRIDVDEDEAVRLELARQGLKPDAVPAAGQRVLIQRNGNVAFDVTPSVHPSFAEIAGLAARIVGLDVAGVDLVAEDITRPASSQRAAVVEVNAGPGLLMHLKPASGEAQPVGEAIVNHLFEEHSDGRIPVIGVTGSRHAALIARWLAWVIQVGGRKVGMASSDGTFLGTRCIAPSSRSPWQSARKILMNPSVEVAIFEHRPEHILAEGLPYDRAQVGIVTDVTHGPECDAFHVHSEEQTANVVRTQIDVVLPQGAAVLNAGNAGAAQLAEYCDGEVIYYHSRPDASVVIEHLARNGRAVYPREGAVIIAEGQQERKAFPLSIIPALEGQNAEQCTEVICAVVAAAAALEIDMRTVVAAIESFGATKPNPAGPCRENLLPA